MKPIVLLLVLANLFFLAWSQWLAPRDREMAAPASQGPKLPGLQLASEHPPAPARTARSAPPAESARTAIIPDVPGEDVAATDAESAVPGSEPELLSAVARCVTIGPFRTLAEATQGSATLRGSGHQPRTRVAEGEVWAGLWVSLRDLPSRADAQKTMGMLREHGITDAFVMPASGGRSDISLGIFSDTDRAQRRAEEVRTLGFTPTVTDRTRRGTVYWIDVDLKPTDGFINPASLQPESGKIVRLEIQACPGEPAG